MGSRADKLSTQQRLATLRRTAMDIRMWKGGNRGPIAYSLANRTFNALNGSSFLLGCLVVVGVLAEARELVVVRGLLGALSLNLVWTLPQH